MQGVCTWPWHDALVSKYKLLLSGGRGDLNLECVYTVVQVLGICNRKQKLKMFLQCLGISDISIVPFLYLFSGNK